MRWVFVPQSEVYSTGSVFDSAGTYVPTLVRIPLSSVWSQAVRALLVFSPTDALLVIPFAILCRKQGPDTNCPKPYQM